MNPYLSNKHKVQLFEWIFIFLVKAVSLPLFWSTATLFKYLLPSFFYFNCETHEYV